MFKFTLKISIILLCAGAHAEQEAVNNIADSKFETVDVQFTEIIESLLLGDKVLQSEILPEEPAFKSVEKVLIETVVEDILSGADDTNERKLIEQESQPPVFTNTEETAWIKDIVLVLGNSGSMEKNDPSFFINKVVKEFINQQDGNTRIGMVIFDQEVCLPVALTNTSLANRTTLFNSLENINYKGLYTDSHASIKCAIYELKNNGRDDAEKFIIFMIDGIDNTNAVGRDLEKPQWLREDLASDAEDNKIKIFAIASTDGEDFQLIQSISKKTDNEYYRTLTIDGLQNIFKQINEIMNTPPEPKRVSGVIQPILIKATPAPVTIEVPVQTIGKEEYEHIRSTIIIAAIILTIILLGILILFLRRNRRLKAGTDVVVQEAYLNDLQGKTDKQTHKLGTKPTMFGRVAGKDTDHLDYIVVNESTISRRHSLIEYKDCSYWIVDQGSINGTFVNGKPVINEVRLKQGDRIRLHKYDFEFYYALEEPEFNLDSDDESVTLRKDDI